jgi:hypothetical protein
VADDTYSAPSKLNSVDQGDGLPDVPSGQQLCARDDRRHDLRARKHHHQFRVPAQMQQDTVKYTLTGAFATTTNWNNLEYTNPNLAPIAARIGDASVSTCEIGGARLRCADCSITINNVTITKDSITFLMSGGKRRSGRRSPGALHPAGVHDQQILGTYNPNSCGDPVLKGDQHYVNFDTSGLIG